MKFKEYEKIAENIGAQEIVKQIKELEQKYKTQELNILIMGEFASGKTSLINKFFNINLPVDIKPTTATIFKIRGCDSEKHIVHFKNGEKKEVSLEEIKSINPKDISFIEICIKNFDKNINFIDTPGLSSLDEFHREALENYIENADVILLAVDINQGLVKTSKQFLEDNITHSQKVYLTLTKADTKTLEDINKQKEYIKNNFNGFEKVIAVSKNNIDELLELLDEIKSKKEMILRERITEKLHYFCKMLNEIITSMLEVDTSDLNSLKEKRNRIEKELEKIENELSQKEKELLNKIDYISSNASNILLKKLQEKKSYIADALYDEDLNEGLNDRLKETLKEAIQEMSLYIEKELKSNLDDLQNSLTTDYSIKDFTINIVDIIVKFREIIIGGLITLLSKLPMIGQIISIAGAPLQGILEQATKHLSKKYVENKLEEVFLLIKKDTEKTIKKSLENNIDMLFEEFTKEIKLKQKSFEESLDKLEDEISNKEKDIKKYIESLKEYQSQLKCEE